MKNTMEAAIKADFRYGILNHEYDEGFRAGYTAAKRETCVWEIINSGFPLVGCNKTVFDDIENSIPPFCPDCGCRVEKMEVDNG